MALGVVVTVVKVVLAVGVGACTVVDDMAVALLVLAVTELFGV